MTETQIYALIGTIIPVGLLFWFGYMIGRSEGITIGLKTGEDSPREQDLKAIRDLEASLQSACKDQEKLLTHCQRLEQSLAFGPTEEAMLLDIAEKLRIAAETFSAFRTGKKLERDCLTLRAQALEMAGLLNAIKQVNAA